MRSSSCRREKKNASRQSLPERRFFVFYVLGLKSIAKGGTFFPSCIQETVPRERGISRNGDFPLLYLRNRFFPGRRICSSYNIYRIYTVYCIFRTCSVCSIFSTYSIFGICSVCSTYSIYSVFSIYSSR